MTCDVCRGRITFRTHEGVAYEDCGCGERPIARRAWEGPMQLVNRMYPKQRDSPAKRAARLKTVADRKALRAAAITA